MKARSVRFLLPALGWGLLACSSTASQKPRDAAADERLPSDPPADSAKIDLPGSSDARADLGPAKDAGPDLLVARDASPDESKDTVVDLPFADLVNRDRPPLEDAVSAELASRADLVVADGSVVGDGNRVEGPRDVLPSEAVVRDGPADVAGVCSPGNRLSCNDDPNASAVWGACQPDGTCLCNTGFVQNPATGRCTLPGRDAARDTDTGPGVCTGTFDACVCRCCDGIGRTPMCYYPSIGENLADIAADTEAKTLATDCTMAGCASGIHYVCCMPADPEPATSATYTAEGYSGGLDHLGVQKAGADCATLVFSSAVSGTDGFRVDGGNRWGATSAGFGPCGDAGAMERARGALGTLAFRRVGDTCVLDLHATLFAITATGEVKTARMDAEGVAVPSSLPDQCR